MRTKRFKAALLSTLVIVSLMVPAITLLSVSPVSAQWLEYVIVQGSSTCYNTNLAGPPPERTYGLGEMPPIMAAKEIGAGKVVAAGIGRTCNWGETYGTRRWTEGELDVLLDKAFQWMVLGATKVLWYGEYEGREGTVEYVYNDAKRCSYLIDSLEAKGYTVDDTIDGTFTEITSDLLAPYDILVIPQIQLGDGTIGGDPDSLPDADVAAIVNFVKVDGKGLIIMEAADSTTFFTFNKVQNKILEALDFGVYFQHDSIVDEDDTEPYVTADVNESHFGADYRSETGKTTVRLYRVASLLVPGPGVAVGITPKYQESMPGSTLTFSVSVTNSDEVEDSYHLTVSDTAGWGLTLSDEDLINVPGFGTETTTLTVTIPPGAVIGVEDNITVSVESTVKENVSDSASCTVLVATQITPPIDDAYTHEGRPDAKLGSGVNMFVGWYDYHGSTGAERTWLKFDLSILPADATIGKVKLWLYSYLTTGWGSHGTRGYGVNNDDWLENEITWGNQPTIGGELGETKAIEETGWYSWDVTSFVQSERTEDNLVSFCLVDQDENTEVDHSPWFSAKEYEDSKLWPYLEFVPAYRVDVSASPDWPQDASPGGTLTYDIIVTNTGFSADSYSLSVTDNQGWGPTIAENQFTDVQPDQSVTTTLTVTIPSDASVCTKNIITVTATGMGTGVSDDVVCEAHAFTGVKLSPTDDAHVAEGYPNDIYGSENTLYLQSSTTGYKNERIFLKFDLSTIPFDATIIDAEVWLWSQKAESADINAQCRKVTDDVFVDEDMITWGTSQGLEKDVLDTVALKFLPPSEDTWISWNVTSFVQSEFAGDMKASFCIKAETEGTSGRYIFNSKEWPNENERPYLKVTYPIAAPLERGVQVSIVLSEQSGALGKELTYTVTVTNTGEAEDNFDLTIVDNAGWGPTLSQNSLTNVENGASRTVTLTVTIPSDATDGDSTEITVTATSRGDPTKSGSATCTATAEAAAEFPIIYLIAAVVIIVVILGAVLMKRRG